MPYKKCNPFPTTVKAYKIYCPEHPNDMYVGSTRRIRLCDRMPGHRSAAKMGKTFLFQKIREFGKFEYEMLGTRFCQDFDEQTKFEKEWWTRLKPNLNTNNPNRSKEETKAYTKAYNDTPETKVNMKAYMKAYNAKWLAKPENRAYMKAYNATPKTKAAKNAWGVKRVSCECGVEVSRSYLSSHRKTKKHLKKVAQ